MVGQNGVIGCSTWQGTLTSFRILETGQGHATDPDHNGRIRQSSYGYVKLVHSSRVLDFF